MREDVLDDEVWEPIMIYIDRGHFEPIGMSAESLSPDLARTQLNLNREIVPIANELDAVVTTITIEVCARQRRTQDLNAKF